MVGQRGAMGDGTGTRWWRRGEVRDVMVTDVGEQREIEKRIVSGSRIFFFRNFLL